MNATAPGSFPVAAHRSLKRRGVGGYPRAWIDGEALHIKGSTELAIPLARIEHVRIGPFFGGARTSYAAVIRLEGEAEPIELGTYRGSPAFAEAMRCLASAAMKKRIGLVEGGMPVARSLVALLLLSVFGAAVGNQVAVMFGLGSWARAALPLLGLAVTVPAYAEAFRKAPRRILSLSELDDFLPRAAARPAQRGGLAT